VAREEVRLDLTPLIDCVFLMLIFFVLIDFRVLEQKLPVSLSLERGSPLSFAPPRDQLLVRITALDPGQPVYARGGPGAVDPLSRRPFRYALTGHRVRWEVGPVRADSREALLQELRTAFGAQALWPPDPRHPASRKPPAIAIAPGPGTCVDDVAATTDAARAAGFTEIEFAGGRSAPGGR
jgi:hypothetical protein